MTENLSWNISDSAKGIYDIFSHRSIMNSLSKQSVNPCGQHRTKLFMFIHFYGALGNLLRACELLWSILLDNWRIVYNTTAIYQQFCSFSREKHGENNNIESPMKSPPLVDTKQYLIETIDSQEICAEGTSNRLLLTNTTEFMLLACSSTHA